MCISVFKEMLTNFQVTRPISQNKEGFSVKYPSELLSCKERAEEKCAGSPECSRGGSGGGDLGRLAAGPSSGRLFSAVFPDGHPSGS